MSYCYEYCGRINVIFRNLQFRVGENEVKFDAKVRGSCMINVH